MKVFGICCGRKNGNTELMMTEALRGGLSIDPEEEIRKNYSENFKEDNAKFRVSFPALEK